MTVPTGRCGWHSWHNPDRAVQSPTGFGLTLKKCQRIGRRQGVGELARATCLRECETARAIRRLAKACFQITECGRPRPQPCSAYARLSLFYGFWTRESCCARGRARFGCCFEILKTCSRELNCASPSQIFYNKKSPGHFCPGLLVDSVMLSQTRDRRCTAHL